MYRIVRPLLFRMDAEDAHVRVIAGLARWRVGAGLARRWFSVEDERLRVECFGVRFENPVGIAAGLDKHGEAVGAWERLGFGFVEVGTVTPRAQEGNPRPRLFRLVPERAIVNRMGFNSVGAHAVRENLQRRRSSVPVGINVGRNRDTPNDRAAADYASAIEVLRGMGAYFVINVSSPNTAGLRALQAPEQVAALVSAAVAEAGGAPVLVKVAPDFGPGELEDTVRAAQGAGAAGFVASNTTLSRSGVGSSRLAGEAGGLSGAPLRALATETVRRVYRVTDGKLPIIGVGGVASAGDAWEKIAAGARLVQVYTGLVYEGPGLARRINRGLLARLDEAGFGSIGEAVGSSA